MNIKTETQLFAERVHKVPQSFIREILKVASSPDIVSFAGGLPNPALFPVREMEECARLMFEKRGRQVLQYSETEGYYPLREYISQRYKHRFGLDISPKQILITSGSQQALDLLGKIFLDPGDAVLMERPTYLGALQCFSVFEPRFREVSLNDDGIDIDEFEEQMFEEAPRLFYCIPNFQNPTGLQYSLEKRQKIAEIAANYSTFIIEDDPYGDINFSGEQLPPIYSYLPEQTILLGSFSKTVAPGLRIGWMIANPEVIKRATVMKQACDLHSNNLSQHTLFEFLSNYDFDQHISKIINAYQFQRNVMMSCLEEYFPEEVRFTRPNGGMFCWLTLPEYITARQFLEKAMEQKVIFVPGDTFYAGKADWQTLRLNFSNVDEGTMRQALRKLGAVLEYARW